MHQPFSQRSVGVTSEAETTEPPTAPGRRSINGCPLLRVCVHGVCVHCCVCALWMGQMQSTNSEYGSPYLAVCHVTKKGGKMFHIQIFTFFVLVLIIHSITILKPSQLLLSKPKLQ